jgi:hypothetical protein
VRTLRLALSLLLAAAPLAAQRRSGTTPPPRPDEWPLALGTEAGFVNVHQIGSAGDLDALMFPAWGSSLVGVAGLPLPTVPSLYMTIPIAPKMAIEPNLDITRNQTARPFSTRFAANLGGRLDYSFGHGFYGAAGVKVMIIKVSRISSFGVPGVGIAGGYRFHLSGAWGGRFEISHDMMAKHATTGLVPVNVTAITVGAMVALR